MVDDSYDSENFKKSTLSEIFKTVGLLLNFSSLKSSNWHTSFVRFFCCSFSILVLERSGNKHSVTTSLQVEYPKIHNQIVMNAGWWLSIPDSTLIFPTVELQSWWGNATRTRILWDYHLQDHHHNFSSKQTIVNGNHIVSYWFIHISSKNIIIILNYYFWKTLWYEIVLTARW